MSESSGARTLAFEIGCEEIPAFDLHDASVQLKRLVPDALDEVRLNHGEVEIYATPRRLVVIVRDVQCSTEPLDETFRGPASRIAFDENGAPTKAAIGFAKSRGVEVDELVVADEGGCDYVFASRHVDARFAMELLPSVLEGLIRGISWPKSCRWGTGHDYFSRPVRWLLALFGSDVVPVEFAGLVADRYTFAHRVLAPGSHEVACADDLLGVLSAGFVVAGEDERASIIRDGITCLENQSSLHARLPEKTFAEVVNLCEYPSVVLGHFDEEFLQVPEEIIVDAMLMHQRYFPLYDDAGDLTNSFIIVSNGDPACENIIVNGNERVVAARLYDAKFFYDEDLKHPLEYYVDRLSDIVFQESLGTMRDKTDRICGLVDFLAKDAGVSDDVLRDAERAAFLAKADLVTSAVVEFTSVQGVMGSYYAAASGENERVCRAIGEQYRPRFAGDVLPSDIVGRLVALADKIDTICGLFAVDQMPSGSSDPFALRRAAIGILTMLLDNGADSVADNDGVDGTVYSAGVGTDGNRDSAAESNAVDISLVSALCASLDAYANVVNFDRDAVLDLLIDFFLTRTKVMLRDEGCSPEIIDSVAATGIQEPVELVMRARALARFYDEHADLLDDLVSAYVRANNLRDTSAGTDVDTNCLNEAESRLLNAITSAENSVSTALGAHDYPAALEALSCLRAPIDDFFTSTMIMDDDLDIRANRMRLLNRFVEIFHDIADFSFISKPS